MIKAISRFCWAGFICCVVYIFIVILQMSALGETTTNDKISAETIAIESLHIEEFGTMEGNPVNNGFVFINGQYLDVPYVVTRKGLAIFINTKIIEKPISWPLVKKVPEEIIDPRLPFTINKETSQFDPVLSEYIGAKIAYIRKYYSEEKKKEMLLNVYRDLPCVEKAEYDPKRPNIAIVQWHDGSYDRINLDSFEGRQPIKYDKQSILELLETHRKNLEERLKKGDCYFFFDKGGKITFGEQNAIEILPQLIQISKLKETVDRKFTQIQGVMSYVDKESFSSIVTGFSASLQLEERLNRLINAKRSNSGQFRGSNSGDTTLNF